MSDRITPAPLIPVGTAYMPSDELDAIYRVPTGRVIIPLLILLMAWLFIMQAGTANKRFHPDEALYTTFARNAFVHGDWQLTSPLDKPPISIYANAIAQALFGAVITDKGVYDLPIRVGEFVARIPNIFAGIITVALFIALEKKLFPIRIPIGSLSLIASYLFISLSTSAFTDSLMLMWVMGAWLCIERKQSFLSGFLLMVGFATKPQAIFLLPLLVMRGLWGKSFRDWLSFVAGMTIPLGLLLLWDASRGTTSIFALGQYNYPTQGIISPPNQLQERFIAWIGYMTTASGWLILGIFLPIMSQEKWSSPLWVILIGYSLFHILGGFPMYDRYALLLTPIITFLSVGGMWRYVDRSKYGQQWIRYYLMGFFLFIIIPYGIILYDFLGNPEYTSNYSIGRDGYPLDKEGAIISLADEINALPFGAIVYDHWRGWELGYYLGAWSDKRRVYYPDPITQAEDSLNNPEMWTRYLVAPIDVDYDTWLSAMRDVGYEISVYRQVSGYIIFALDPPPR
jgi:Gpi18-like mannosyltransferase